ncbi:hypothetical protein ACE6H2_000497 [Prunus campanulata]
MEAQGNHKLDFHLLEAYRDEFWLWILEDISWHMSLTDDVDNQRTPRLIVNKQGENQVANNGGD